MNTEWIAGLAGGALIGLAAALLLLGNGRIAGAAGIFRGFLTLRPDHAWAERAAFVAGLMIAPLLFLAAGQTVTITIPAGWPLMAAGGVIVAVGVWLANGCTSGHGVCGMARLSRRSIAATLTFMAVCAATVAIIRHPGLFA